MTVLVDDPLWPWRGQRWAHLVSDSSHEELHEFARQLGKRRLGFQGDHYDVDEIDHGRALALGAEAVASRDLVRRLRAAGLRDRVGKPRWREIARWPAGVTVDGFAAAVDPEADAAHRLALAVQRHGPLSETAGVVAFADDAHLVALFELAPHHASPNLVVDVDLHVIGAPRADRTSSIELFVRR